MLLVIWLLFPFTQLFIFLFTWSFAPLWWWKSCGRFAECICRAGRWCKTMFETQCFWMPEYCCPLYCPTTQCPTLNVTIYSLTIASVIVTFILREYLNQKHCSIRLSINLSGKNRMISFLQNSIACFVHKTNDAPGTVLWQISKWRPRLHAFLQTKWISQMVYYTHTVKYEIETRKLRLGNYKKLW